MTTQPDRSKVPMRDEVYYMDMSVFLVEDTLFKVPQVRWKNSSEIFRTMFSLPQETGGSTEGATDSTPIKLDGISKADFRALLKVLYPLDSPQKLEMPKRQWLSVLKLSTMWSFFDVRRQAVKQVSGMLMTAEEKIQLGRQHKVKNWLFEGYVARTQSQEPISLQEMNSIGNDTAILLSQCREDYIKGKTDCRDIIKRVFGAELREIEEAEAEYAF